MSEGNRGQHSPTSIDSEVTEVEVVTRVAKGTVVGYGSVKSKFSISLYHDATHEKKMTSFILGTPI